jgi:osmoprotectant transport system substrate-binding protein
VKPSWRRLFALVVTMSAIVLAAAACGGDDGEPDAAATTAAETEAGGEKPGVVLGTKNFTEQYILGELYRQALEAKGFEVELKSDIGSTEIIDASLTSGQIDMYPEYTGTALTVVFGEEGSAKTAEETYQQAKERYEERGQTLLDRTPFSNSDAIAVLKTTADENGLKTVGDLKKLESVRLGGQPEFRTRAQGLPGLKKHYGLTNIEFVPFAGISAYEALDKKTVDAAAIFSTDPALATGKYVILEDTGAQFGFQNIAPVVDDELADDDELVATVNAVSKKLTARAIIAMNKAVDVDKKSPDVVARQFLQANDLV